MIKKGIWCPETQTFRANSGETLEELKDRLKDLKRESVKREKDYKSFVTKDGKMIVQYKDEDIDKCYSEIAAILAKYDTEVASKVIRLLKMQDEDYFKAKYALEEVPPE